MLDSIDGHFAELPSGFQMQFLPAMMGLREAVRAEGMGLRRQQATGGRVFVGWTVNRHWLMPSDD